MALARAHNEQLPDSIRARRAYVDRAAVEFRQELEKELESRCGGEVVVDDVVRAVDAEGAVAQAEGTCEARGLVPIDVEVRWSLGTSLYRTRTRCLVLLASELAAA